MQAALRAVLGMIAVEIVEVGAVVAGQRDAVSQIARGIAVQRVDHPVHGHDALAQTVDQFQIGCEGDVIVAVVIVSGNVDGVIGENRNAHEP